MIHKGKNTLIERIAAAEQAAKDKEKSKDARTAVTADDDGAAGSKKMTGAPENKKAQTSRKVK